MITTTGRRCLPNTIPVRFRRAMAFPPFTLLLCSSFTEKMSANRMSLSIYIVTIQDVQFRTYASAVYIIKFLKNKTKESK